MVVEFPTRTSKVVLSAQKLQSLHVEAAIQADAFECLRNSVSNDGLTGISRKVDISNSLDVAASLYFFFCFIETFRN